MLTFYTAGKVHKPITTEYSAYGIRVTEGIQTLNKGKQIIFDPNFSFPSPLFFPFSFT